MGYYYVGTKIIVRRVCRHQWTWVLQDSFGSTVDSGSNFRTSKLAMHAARKRKKAYVAQLNVFKIQINLEKQQNEQHNHPWRRFPSR